LDLIFALTHFFGEILNRVCQMDHNQIGWTGSSHNRGLEQGCQIFLGSRYQKRKKSTKNVPNDPKIYKSISDGRKTNQHFPI
jgi:hypothetical protein